MSFATLTNDIDDLVEQLRFFASHVFKLFVDCSVGFAKQELLCICEFAIDFELHCHGKLTNNLL